MKGTNPPAPAITHNENAFPLSGCPLSRRRVLGMLGGILFAGLSGCTTKPSGGEGGSGGGGGSTSANVLRYPLTTELTTIDPAKVEDGTTIDLVQNVFEGLVQWDEKTNVAPNLAEKWDVSADGKVYTFHLKKGVKFHNGRELTADDFKYSLERAARKSTASPTVATYLNDIVGFKESIASDTAGLSGVKVIDPSTLEITIDAAKPFWLGKMTYPTGYVVCKEAIEKNKNTLDESNAVGTGPFQLKPADFRRGYEVKITANDAYHQGRPKLDAIIRPIIKDGDTRLNKYIAGEIDILQEVSSASLDRINSDSTLKNELHQFKRANTWYLALNVAAPDSPFAKKEVRQAFAMAIDRDEVLRVALKGQATRADGIVAPGMVVQGAGEYKSTVKPQTFDPAKAKQLLAQAGYPDGKGFPLLNLAGRNDYPEVVNAIQVVAGQLKANLGIEIQPKPMEWGSLLKERLAKTMPFYMIRWSADYPDPQDYLSVMLHTDKNGDHPENGVGYSSPQFDQLCDQADSEKDSSKRLAMYQQAEEIAMADLPWIPLYYKPDLELIKPRVDQSSIRDSLLGHLPHRTTVVKS